VLPLAFEYGTTHWQQRVLREVLIDRAALRHAQ
jgi:hypothetical protein